VACLAYVQIWCYNYRIFGRHPSSCFLFKNNVSETGFCLRPQVKAYSVGSNR
jgi:hypothetical protein